MYIKSNDLFRRTNPERIFETVPRPIVLADSLLTPENMGAMIRLSDNIGATKMIFFGEQPGAKALGHLRRCAASSRDNIEWFFSEETDVRKFIGSKTLVAIETTDDATNIFDTVLPRDIAFLVGSESRGIRPEILAQCDKSVYIPVPGPTRSLNVSHAASVAMFCWLQQMMR